MHTAKRGVLSLNNRGIAVEHLLLNNLNLTLRNTHKTRTHFYMIINNFSTTNLTLCYPSNSQSIPKWLLNEANWPLLTALTANIDHLIQFTDFIIQTANEAVPTQIPS